MSLSQSHELEAALAAESAARRVVRAQLPHIDAETVDLTSLEPVQLAALEALEAAREQRRRLVGHLVPPQP